VCGESRTHGDNGGDGETPFGCALCPYPLRTGGQRWCATQWSSRKSVVVQAPAAERGALGGENGSVDPNA